MRKATLLFSAILFAVAVLAQSYQQGKVVKWDVEAYGKNGGVTRNAAVYYVQIGGTVYQITRGRRCR